MAASISVTRNEVRRQVHDAFVRAQQGSSDTLIERLTTAIYAILTGAEIPVDSTTSVKEGDGINVTDNGDGSVTVAAEGVLVKDEGSDVVTSLTLNFVGAGVSVTNSPSGTARVSISGGGGGGGTTNSYFPGGWG